LCGNGQIGIGTVVKVPVRFLNPLARWTFPHSRMRESLMPTRSAIKETREMPELPEYRNLISGELRAPESGSYLDVQNPATGETWARIPASDKADVNAAADAAAAAFPAWSAMAAAERGYFLTKIGELFAQHGEELVTLEIQDNGFPVGKSLARFGPGLQFLWNRAAASTLDAVTGKSVTLAPDMLGITRREPYGVVAIIVPWNAPIGIMSNKVACALAAGNTVVVKPAEQASVSVLRFAELVAQVLPPGVLNIVSGTGEVAGDALVRHRHIRKITMTGSTETGRAIQRAAADLLTPSVFELGGKSPNIVFADADLDAATIGVTTLGIFIPNAGQGCVAGSRILLQRPIFDEMVQRIQAVVDTLVLGDPLDPATTMGPIISGAQLDRVVGYLEIGKKEADLLFGGRHGGDLVPQALSGGHWVQPTLFKATDNSLRICQEEIFGPVGVVIPFDTEEEALAIANDCRYGLASGVWTRDLARAHRFVREIESGTVWVNTYFQTRYELPFGGIKDSGYGHDDVLAFTREKAAVIQS
jgi:aldehyde dehydrogenase (NAD+)